MGTIVVAPLGKIAELAVRHRCRDLLSLVAPKQTFHRPAVIAAERHLIVNVNDIAFAGTGNLVAPGEGHVAAIIDFARGWDRQTPLLVHCMMGVSRSPAAALIAALAVEPDQDEHDLAERLRRASVQATPNVRLIEIGDHVLARGGRLVAAVRAIGRGADYVGDSPFVFSAVPETVEP